MIKWLKNLWNKLIEKLFGKKKKDKSPTFYFIHGLGGLPGELISYRMDAIMGCTGGKLTYNAGGLWKDNWKSLLNQTKKADSSTIFIGESMGGFFAMQLANHYKARCYLLNPAIDPDTQIRQFIGNFTLPDGRVVQITDEVCSSYKEAPDPRTESMRDKIILMLSYSDPLLNPKDTQNYYDDWCLFVDWVDDDHGIVKDSSFDIIAERLKLWTI